MNGSTNSCTLQASLISQQACGEEFKPMTPGRGWVDGNSPFYEGSRQKYLPIMSEPYA